MRVGHLENLTSSLKKIVKVCGPPLPKFHWLQNEGSFPQYAMGTEVFDLPLEST